MPRNPQHQNCHCGDDELWIGLDELIEVVGAIVDHRLGIDHQAPEAGQRAAVRSRLEAGRRRGQAPEPDRM